MTRRWSALAATVAVLGASGVLTSSAASTDPSVLVPIRPCRLVDTRPAPDNVGPRATPLHAGDTYTVDVWGTHGNCTIPSGVTGVSLNVTAVNPTAASFLTVFPADAGRPLAANLNWVAHQPPTPNAVTAALSADGRLSLYNLAGDVDLTVDIVGWYEHESPTPGPKGPKGPTGDAGPAAGTGPAGTPLVRPARDLWVADSGGDFTSLPAALASISDNASHRYVIHLAPGNWSVGAGMVLKDNVDIVGSGQDVTTISGTGDTAVASPGTTLHTTLRDLTISESHPATLTAHTNGLTLTGTSGPWEIRLSNVTVVNTSDTASSSWNARGLLIGGGGIKPILDHVTVHTSGYVAYGFIVQGGGQVRADHVTATADGSGLAFGIFLQGQSELHDVSATATGNGADAAVGIGTMNTTVLIDGATASGSGAINDNVGLDLRNTTSTVHDVQAVAVSSTGTHEWGVHVYDSGTATLERVDAAAANASGTDIAAMRVESGTVNASHSTFTADQSAGTSRGIHLVGGTVTLSNSTAGSIHEGILAASGTAISVFNSTIGGQHPSEFVHTGASVACLFVSFSDGAPFNPNPC